MNSRKVEEYPFQHVNCEVHMLKKNMGIIFYKLKSKRVLV